MSLIEKLDAAYTPGMTPEQVLQVIHPPVRVPIRECRSWPHDTRVFILTGRGSFWRQFGGGITDHKNEAYIFTVGQIIAYDRALVSNPYMLVEKV